MFINHKPESDFTDFSVYDICWPMAGLLGSANQKKVCF